MKHTMEESYTIKWEEVEVVNHHPHHRQRCGLEDWTEWHKMKRDTKVHAFSVQLTSPPVIFISPTDFVGEHPLLYMPAHVSVYSSHCSGHVNHIIIISNIICTVSLYVCSKL